MDKKELKVLAEAIEWAYACDEDVQTMAEAINWAINEYQFNLEDEDCVDRKAIERKIKVLKSIRERLED